MVRYLVMCGMSKTVCAFGEGGGERTKNRHFARNSPAKSDNTTQTLYSTTQTLLLGSWHCALRDFRKFTNPTMKKYRDLVVYNKGLFLMGNETRRCHLFPLVIENANCTFTFTPMLSQLIWRQEVYLRSWGRIFNFY